MSKLFTDDKSNTYQQGQLTRNGQEIQLEDLDLSVAMEDFKDFYYFATENYKGLVNKLEIASHLTQNLQTHEVGSEAYLYCLESLRPFMNQIATTLDVSYSVPALEDFTSEYSVKASHTVTMEGIKEFFGKIWDAIKKFFALLWKKTVEFTKRLTKTNMSISMYEEYTEKLIRKIEREKLEATDKLEFIETKLPSMIARKDASQFSSTDVHPSLINIKTNLTTLETLSMNSVKTVAKSIDILAKETSNLDKHITSRRYNSDNLPGYIATGLRDEEDNVTLVGDITSIIDTIKVINEFKDILLTTFTPHEAKKSDPYIASLFPNQPGTLTNVKSLMNHHDDSNRLPNNYNVFAARFEAKSVLQFDTAIDSTGLNNWKALEGKVLLTDSYSVGINKKVEELDHLETKLKPITSRSELSNIFSLYKEISKIATSLEKVEKELSKSNKDIDYIIDHTRNSGMNILKYYEGHLNNIRTANPEYEEGTLVQMEKNAAGVINMISTIFNSYQSTLNKTLESYKDYSKNCIVDIYATSTVLRATLIKYIYESARNFK